MVPLFGLKWLKLISLNTVKLCFCASQTIWKFKIQGVKLNGIYVNENCICSWYFFLLISEFLSILMFYAIFYMKILFKELQKLFYLHTLKGTVWSWLNNTLGNNTTDSTCCNSTLLLHFGTRAYVFSNRNNCCEFLAFYGVITQSVIQSFFP